MTFGERLVHYRTKKNLSQKRLAEILGITPTRLNYWEKDKREPDVPMIKALSQALGVSGDVLIGLSDDLDEMDYQHPDRVSAEQRLTFREINHIKKYRALDAHGKELVDLVLNKESERMTTIEELALPVDLSAFRLSEQSAAAGLGTYLGPESFRTIMVKRDALPRKASFGVPVAGDSMEPKYHDGDILIISTEQPMCGEVGIYSMDGQGYVKVLGDGELISLNPAYDPLPMTEDIICNGKVIGVLDRAAIVEC